MTIRTDYHNDREYYYNYDLVGRIRKTRTNDGSILEYNYDNAGNLSEYSYTINGFTNTVNYSHNNTNGQYNNTTKGYINKSYFYDDSVLKRLNEIKINNSSTNLLTISKGFSNTDVVNGTITNRVSSVLYSFTQDGTSYEDSIYYDSAGNVSKIIREINSISYTIEFFYDDLNQLTRENNELYDYTHTYSYYSNGNISYQNYYNYTAGNGSLSVPNSYETYSYDSVWKDQLFSLAYYDLSNYNNNYEIQYTYDNHGLSANVTDITCFSGACEDVSLEWENRSLTSYIIKDSSDVVINEYTYKYNDKGIRTSKTVDGITTTYYLDGSHVLSESNGTTTIYYSYDVDGTLLTMTYNGTEYIYVYNTLGDVSHLLDLNGNIVLEYKYDSYGNIVNWEDIKTNTLANINPYTFRGYIWDKETNLYYLNSRYYNPETGRFLNGDGMIQSSSSVLGNNLFTYTENNPVMNVDPTGYCSFVGPNEIDPSAQTTTGLCSGGLSEPPFELYILRFTNVLATIYTSQIKHIEIRLLQSENSTRISISKFGIGTMNEPYGFKCSISKGCENVEYDALSSIGPFYNISSDDKFGNFQTESGLGVGAAFIGLDQNMKLKLGIGLSFSASIPGSRGYQYKLSFDINSYLEDIKNAWNNDPYN